jgi:hypothetical protein
MQLTLADKERAALAAVSVRAAAGGGCAMGDCCAIPGLHPGERLQLEMGLARARSMWGRGGNPSGSRAPAGSARRSRVCPFSCRPPFTGAT